MQWLNALTYIQYPQTARQISKTLIIHLILIFNVKPNCPQCTGTTKELALPFQYFWKGSVLFFFLWNFMIVLLLPCPFVLPKASWRHAVCRKPQESPLGCKVMMDVFISYLSRAVGQSQHGKQQTGTLMGKWDLSNCYPLSRKAAAQKVSSP